MASGKAWTTPWSVMAMALWPQAAARFTSSAAGVMPSMADMVVWQWSSTRFSGSSSVTVFLWTVLIATGLMVISRSNLL